MSRNGKETTEVVNETNPTPAKQTVWKRLIAVLGMTCYLLNITLRIVIAAVTAIVLISCILGWTPWVTWSLTFGETTITNAGMYAQILVSAVLILQAASVQDKVRLMHNEKTTILANQKYNDVSHAYDVCFQKDKTGFFKAKNQYDQVRERFNYLDDHPDLEHMTDDVLELAAMMATESSGLAEAFSDAKVQKLEAALRLLGDEQDRRRRLMIRAEDVIEKYRSRAQGLLSCQNEVAGDLRRLKSLFDGYFVPLGFEALRFAKKEVDVPAEELLTIDEADRANVNPNGYLNGNGAHF